MGPASLIAFLILATGIAIFAVQNAAPVTVRLGFWALELSLVVVILVAAALGALMTSLVGFPGWIRDRRRLRQQERELQTLRTAQPLTTSARMPPDAPASTPHQPPA